MIGDTEASNGTITLKNMTTGEQSQLTVDDAIAQVR